MNELIRALHKTLGSELPSAGYDLVDLVEIPSSARKELRIKNMEEVLKDFDQDNDENVVSYLVQLRPKGRVALEAPKVTSPNTSGVDKIYDGSGKLNKDYLERNARILLDAGEYALARNIYQTLLKSGVHPSDPLFGLGCAYEREGDLIRAQSHYEESIAYGPSIESCERLASVLIRQGKEQYAAEVIERALKLEDLTETQKYELHKIAGNCWNRAGNDANAESHYRKASEIDPNSDEMRTNIAAVQLKNSNLDQAADDFKRAIALNPANPKALLGLALCLIAKGDKRGAFDRLKRCLDIDATQSSAIFHLTKLAYELKAYSEAEPYLHKFSGLSPVNPNLLFSLAGIQYHMGKLKEARSTAGLVLRLKPAHSGARELMGLIGN